MPQEHNASARVRALSGLRQKIGTSESRAKLLRKYTEMKKRGLLNKSQERLQPSDAPHVKCEQSFSETITAISTDTSKEMSTVDLDPAAVQALQALRAVRKNLKSNASLASGLAKELDERSVISGPKPSEQQTATTDPGEGSCILTYSASSESYEEVEESSFVVQLIMKKGENMHSEIKSCLTDNSSVFGGIIPPAAHRYQQIMRPHPLKVNCDETAGQDDLTENVLSPSIQSPTKSLSSPRHVNPKRLTSRASPRHDSNRSSEPAFEKQVECKPAIVREDTSRIVETRQLENEPIMRALSHQARGDPPAAYQGIVDSTPKLRTTEELPLNHNIISPRENENHFKIVGIVNQPSDFKRNFSSSPEHESPVDPQLSHPPLSGKMMLSVADAKLGDVSKRRSEVLGQTNDKTGHEDPKDTTDILSQEYTLDEALEVAGLDEAGNARNLPPPPPPPPPPGRKHPKVQTSTAKSSSESPLGKEIVLDISSEREKNSEDDLQVSPRRKAPLRSPRLPRILCRGIDSVASSLTGSPHSVASNFPTPKETTAPKEKTPRRRPALTMSLSPRNLPPLSPRKNPFSPVSTLLKHNEDSPKATEETPQDPPQRRPKKRFDFSKVRVSIQQPSSSGPTEVAERNSPKRMASSDSTRRIAGLAKLFSQKRAIGKEEKEILEKILSSEDHVIKGKARQLYEELEEQKDSETTPAQFEKLAKEMGINLSSSSDASESAADDNKQDIFSNVLKPTPEDIADRIVLSMEEDGNSAGRVFSGSGDDGASASSSCEESYSVHSSVDETSSYGVLSSDDEYESEDDGLYGELQQSVQEVLAPIGSLFGKKSDAK